MQGVADLASVQRPVVSMWRKRLAATDQPFPPPLSERPLRFSAAQVAAWLADTGHGNNADARIESPLYSSDFTSMTERPGCASALLLMHQLRGEAITGVHPAEAIGELEGRGLGGILDAARLVDALDDTALCESVDRLAEAAFSAARVLDRLIATFTNPAGPWSGEALTDTGTTFLATIIAELLASEQRAVAPTTAGGLLLAHGLAGRLDEQSVVTCSYGDDAPLGDLELAAWRSLAAHGLGLTEAQPQRRGTHNNGALHVFMRQQVDDATAFFDQVSNLLMDLGPRDALFVVGPATLMTDEAAGPARRELLAPLPAYTAPLRYVARLPKGMSRFGGRRRLALWVFGRPESTWTVAGAHSDTQTDTATATHIAADIAASLSSAVDVRAHAFHSSIAMVSDRFLRRDTLHPPLRAASGADGGEQLARIWEIRAQLPIDLLASLSFRATPTETSVGQAAISYSQAISKYARDFPGSRLPAEHIGTPVAGAATIIGPEEVRDPSRIGGRAIDRLTLEASAPRARLTEPNDVVYVASGDRAATVDHDGGHVVLAPARIFRCRESAGAEQVLDPVIAAADIASQPGSDRQTWQLRTVPADQKAPLAEIMRRTRQRRLALQTELNALSDLETEIANGLSAGTLQAAPTESTKDQV